MKNLIGDIFQMKKKIIVIGGGVAGLSAGIYAQLNGFDSTIIEKNTQVGGLCTGWYRKGYQFDYSIQWLVGTRFGVFNDIYKETHILNEDVKVQDSSYHTTTHLASGKDFTIYTNIEEWQKYLIDNAPEDEKAIRKMCKHMNLCKKLEPFEMPPSLRTPIDYLKALKRSFWSLVTILRFKKMSCKEYLQKLNFKSPWIKEGLVDNYKDDKYSSIAFLLMLSWYTQKNAGYPMGGSLGVAQRMENRYNSLGGKILLRQEVKEVIVENDKAVGVELSNGERLMADYVISCADLHFTLYNMLKGQYLSPKIKQAYKNWDIFSSIVQISIGINATLTTDFPIQITHFQKEIGKTKISHSYRMINYSYDPTIVPEGKSTIAIRFNSPYEIWEKMSKEEYLEEKKKIAQLGREIIEQHYPGFSEKIEVIDVATPLTTVRYCNIWQGAYQGFNPTRANISKQLGQTLPGLGKFYLAGQWLYPGGGVPQSTQSGKWAIQLICKEEKQKFVSQSK